MQRQLLVASGLVALLLACEGSIGGGGGGGGSGPSSGIDVRVAPAEVRLRPGDAQQFTATVSGATDPSVLWSTDAGPSGGSISANGLFVAPAAEGTYHVFVASAVDPKATDFATVTVNPDVVREVSVAVQPQSASTKPGLTVQLSATVTGADDLSVTWSVEEGASGGTVSDTGLYTAPAAAGTYHVVATSVADPSKSDSAEITVDEDVTPTIVVTVNPTTATVQVGQQQKFNAAVSGTDRKDVTWSVQENGGGEVDPTGLYTAPDVAGSYHVVATSVEDGTKSASALVTVKPKPVENPIDTTILPAARRDVWNPGIPGGIPTDRVTFTTLSSLATDGTGDASAAINKAISDAAAAYASSKKIQEVVLPAGTIRFRSTIRMSGSGVVLRGQGMRETRLRMDGNGDAFLFGADRFTDFTSQFGPWRLASDAARGTNQIVLANADATSIRPGDILCIDQEDDLSYVKIGDGIYGKRQPTADSHGPRLRQSGKWRSVTSMIEVTAVTPGATNTVITLRDPLHMNFTTQYFAEVWHIASPRSPFDGIQYFGIEDLYFTGGTLTTNNVSYCWIKNVEVDGNPGTPNIGTYGSEGGVSGISIELFHTYRCEVRGSYIHHTRDISQGGSAYLIQLGSYSSENLIEDNIVAWGNKLILGNMMGGGNVIAYNYVDNARTSSPTWQEGAIDLNHQAFTHSALVEGNSSMNLVTDSTHGNSGMHVFFRNYGFGRNTEPLWGEYPYNSGNPDRDFMRTAGADGFTREMTYVGNVLRTDASGVYEINQSTQNDNPAAIYRIGWAWNGDGGNRDDGTALANLYRHGNWDSVNDEILWDDGNPVKTIPPSLYLKAKPAFFGDADWPWVDPTGATEGERLKVLPARERFETLRP